MFHGSKEKITARINKKNITPHIENLAKKKFALEAIGLVKDSWIENVNSK